MTPNITTTLRQMAQHTGLDAVAELLREAAEVIERREAVIRILERDAHEAHQRAANAIGTRKVLWNLLGECMPLLEIDAKWSTDYEGKEAIEELMQRITDARTVVQAEELPGSPDKWVDHEYNGVHR